MATPIAERVGAFKEALDRFYDETEISLFSSGPTKDMADDRKLPLVGPAIGFFFGMGATICNGFKWRLALNARVFQGALEAIGGWEHVEPMIRKQDAVGGHVLAQLDKALRETAEAAALRSEHGYRKYPDGGTEPQLH